MNKFFSEDEIKVELYQQEIPFRIATCLAQMYWPNWCENELCKYGLALIKPEGIMLNKTSDILDIITKSGFEVVYSSHKRLTVDQTTEIWKFGWQNASIERILINQKLFSICDSIILILRYTLPSSTAASEILTELKGSSIPERRKSFQIRSQIRPLNYVLNHIHTSDETADFFRELGILYDWDELICVFNALALQRTVSLSSTKQKNIPDTEFELLPWLSSLRIRIGKSDIQMHHKKYILDHLQKLESDSNHRVSLKLLQLLSQYNLINWDFRTIVILSNYIEYMC